jgi:hypothetical protein
MNKKIEGYFSCSPSSHQDPVTKKWILDRKPCNVKIPVYDVNKARRTEPWPRCPKCGRPMALTDLKLNREVSKLFYEVIGRKK